MSKDMMRRLAAVEAGRGELPPEVRLWLGDPITEEERVSMMPPAAQPNGGAAVCNLTAEMSAWFEGRSAVRAN
ncbi:hypothetical protein [Sphingomonas sp. PAMC 26617]|uniref:hypothetical protein n=1 Tax=Sphingomonas sp. PAMC 26617 TaxID=1112216 RepID=UPI000288F983|nr:hypothetical protein [Sphingomonas sp. PAMC 26617]